jgi:predicted TIM-barrel fold metal-dependent hydrolase
MNGAEATSTGNPLVGRWDGPAVDCDVQVRLGTVETLYPYLEDGWVDWVQSTSFRAPPSLAINFPPGVTVTTHPSWKATNGASSVTSYEALHAHLFQPTGPEIAVLNPYWGLDSLRHPELAARLARAINDWLVEQFLDRDPRLRGSVTVVHHDPAEAIREIERVGNHPGFVQVHLPVWSQEPWGRRMWHPMFRAIADHRLVATIHYGGVPDGPPTPTGWPSYFIEHYAAATHMYLTQLISIVAEGLFEAVPHLRISLNDCGFAWLPGLIWRLDKDWKGLRRDVPWVRSAPSATIRERVRVSVQPLEDAPPDELAQAIDWLGSEDMVMYGSAYPRAAGEPIDRLLAGLSERVRKKVMYENARSHFDL